MRNHTKKRITEIMAENQRKFDAMLTSRRAEGRFIQESEISRMVRELRGQLVNIHLEAESKVAA